MSDVIDEMSYKPMSLKPGSTIYIYICTYTHCICTYILYTGVRVVTNRYAQKCQCRRLSKEVASHPRLCLPSWSFPPCFPTKTQYAFLLSLYMLHAPPISFSVIQSWWAQTIKLLIMQSSPVPSYFPRLSPRCLPQHPILEHSQPVSFT
jgi:hypothetical protein